MTSYFLPSPKDERGTLLVSWPGRSRVPLSNTRATYFTLVLEAVVRATAKIPSSLAFSLRWWPRARGEGVAGRGLEDGVLSATRIGGATGGVMGATRSWGATGEVMGATRIWGATGEVVGATGGVMGGWMGGMLGATRIWGATASTG